jgi:hypothetical protein
MTKSKTRLAYRQAWMAAFEREVLKLNPAFAGKIEWQSAEHFFNIDLDVQTAADRYVTTRA